MISRIGKYTVEAELGRGGFGQVYKAWDADVRQPVAIKVLLAQGDPDLLKRFQLEVVTTASLHHKNIVTIHASGEEEGIPYLVMELLEGQTLSQVIKGRVPLSLLDKVRIMTQVAEGLAYAHSKGVVHRDVKPANIMLLRDGSVKIMDFGIALAPNRRTVSMTLDGFVLGTVPYMSPEQFTSDCKANEQTDIFAFGEVYYELLTGRHPFDRFLGDLTALRVAILTHEPAALSEVVPGCPEALELLVHRSIAKEREFRYQKFEDVRLDSAAVLVDLQHDKAAAILTEVRRLVSAGDLQEARSKVREAQELEPGNREARQLLESIDRRLQETLNRERVAARLTEAEKQLSERRFAEAVQTLEGAARLDTGNVAVQLKLADAKAKLEGAVHASRLVEEARSRQARGELSKALESLRQALEIDPGHTEARRLHPKMSELLARRRREQKQDALRVASEHLEKKQFDEAAAALDRLEAEQPGASGIAELRHEIERQRDDEERRRRAERFELALTRTRETMGAGDLERAAQMLAHLSSNFAFEPGALDALPLLRKELDELVRAREIAGCSEQANELIRRNRVEEASALLSQALSRFPDEPGLERRKTEADTLLQKQRREAAVAEVLARADTLHGAGDLQGALAALDEGQNRLGKEAAFAGPKQELALELERKRYTTGLEHLLTGVRALMAVGRNREAAERIAQAGDYARDAAVSALAISVRTAAAADEEREFVARVLSEQSNLQTRGERERAAAALEKARSRYPRNPDLSHALDLSRAEIERDRRRDAIENHRADILRSIEAQAWKRADAALRRAGAEFPGEAGWAELAARVDEGVREEALQQALSSIRAKLASETLPEATRQIEELRPVFGHDARWRELEAEAVRRREYEGWLEEAERHRRQGDLAGAEAALTGVTSNAPDLRATQLLRSIGNQRAENAAAAERVRAALAREDVNAAAEILGAARARFPGEPLWKQLAAEVAAAEAALKRRAEVSDLAQNVRSLNRENPERAADALQAARGQFPAEAVWNVLEAEIGTARRARRDAIAAGEAAVRERLRCGDTAGAATALAAARSRFPEEAEWAVLQEEIGALERRLEQERADGAAAFDQARALFEADQLGEAVSAARAAAAHFPGEAARVAELLRACEGRLRQRQIAEMLRRAEALLAEGRAQEAAAALDARSDEPAVQELQTRVFQELARQQRRDELCSLERQVPATAGKRKLQRLDRAAGQAAAGYADDEEIAAIAGRVHALVELRLAEVRPARQVPWRGFAVAASLAAAVGGGFWLAPRLRRQPVSVAVEIRTDPPGATVRLKDRSCQTPQCRFDLLPGRYPATAELSGYATHQQNLEVSASHRRFEFQLDPLPPPPPPVDAEKTGPSLPSTGTVVVKTEPGALVYVDGAPRARTDASGSVSLPLEAKAHEVRVERNGYDKPAARQVSIAPGSQQTLVIPMARQTARLQFDGAPSGVEVRIGGAVLGRTDGSTLYRFALPVTPGDQVLEIASGSLKRTVSQRFEPGETARLEWKDVAPAAPPTITAPPKIKTAAELEAEDWEKTHATTDASQLRAFLQKYPDGAHNKSAKSRLADLAWAAVDQKSLDSLRQFLRDNPENPHGPDAQHQIDQLEAAQKEMARQAAAKQLAEQERERQGKLDEVRRQQILDTVTRLNLAFESKRSAEVKKIWRNPPSGILQSVSTPHSRISLINPADIQFTPSGQATLTCDLITSYEGRPPASEKMVLTLQFDGTSWRPESLHAY